MKHLWIPITLIAAACTIDTVKDIYRFNAVEDKLAALEKINDAQTRRIDLLETAYVGNIEQIRRLKAQQNN